MNILLEGDDFDYGDDFDDEEEAVPVKNTPYQFLNSLDQYKAKKHDQRQKNRVSWRQQQRQRYENDIEDSDETDFMSKRTIQKSVVGYKPFQFPLIRFGKFGKASRNFLPADMRQEMGNVTHEAGVSCYLGHKVDNGYSFDLPHPDRASYDVTSWKYQPTRSEIQQLINYLDNGTPMDIFLLHGHLVSHGKANDWLTLGADGEYLLNVNKPYDMKTLKPEEVFVDWRGKLNLVDYIVSLHRNGLDGLRDMISDISESFKTFK